VDFGLAPLVAQEQKEVLVGLKCTNCFLLLACMPCMFQ
jgi:hypothetical protein